MSKLGQWLMSQPLKDKHEAFIIRGRGDALAQKPTGQLTYTVFQPHERYTFTADDIVSATIESGAQAHSRITGTRLALIGVFAFAAPKTFGGEEYLTIETSDRLVTMEIPPKFTSLAHRFVQSVQR